jgi:hypothetical protein
MNAKTYRIRPDITPEQIGAAVDALNPFYGFGCVLDTANEKGGTASLMLHDGQEKPTNDSDDSSVSLEALDGRACILSVSGSWKGVPAVYCGPTLRAEHFFAARDAFMACIEQIPAAAKAESR